MYMSTTSNICFCIENKKISSKKSHAQTIPYFFSTVANENKQTNIKTPLTEKNASKESKTNK